MRAQPAGEQHRQVLPVLSKRIDEVKFLQFELVVLRIDLQLYVYCTLQWLLRYCGNQMCFMYPLHRKGK